MNKKKKFDKYNLIASIAILFTFIMLIVSVIYSYTTNKNNTVSIILYVLTGVGAAITIFSVIKFIMAPPRLKNK